MYFAGQENTSSKKCCYPPGGSSKFQFLYDNASPDPIHFNKYPDTKANYNILNLQQINGEEKENTSVNKNISIKTDYSNGREKVNIFKNEYNDQFIQPSIKITQQPGGNSKVCYSQFP